MLRPYWAVIRDSFHAAMSSRILYVMLGLVTLVLLLLFPFHVRQTVNWEMDHGSFRDIDQLIERLVNDGKSGDRADVANIWNRLSPDLQSEMEAELAKGDEKEKSGPGGDGPGINRKLATELNVLMETVNLYDEKAYGGKRLGEEAKGLLDKGSSRSFEEDRRLNRLLLSKTFRREIERPSATQLDFYYFKWHWSFMTTRTPHAQFASSMTNQLPVFFDKFVMSIGIFIALLVTASIIPEMLEPGSLNLLLSKPVHRWALLIAKYIGGCIFILLCASLFFTGIYFWLGIQLGIWEKAILWSIPVYVLVFAMYYSVSVFVGIWFRSPILCISFALLFWVVCFLVGYSNNLLANRHYNTAPLQMVAFEDQVAIVDALQRTESWDDGNWSTLVDRGASPEDVSFSIASWMDRMDEFGDLPGPVWDDQNEKLVASNSSLVQSMSGDLTFAAIAPDKSTKATDRGKVPNDTKAIFSSKLGQLAVDSSGTVHLWTGKDSELKGADDESEADATEEAGKAVKEGLKKFGISNKPKYKPISDVQDLSVRTPSAASIDPVSDRIAIYSQGQLVVLAPAADGRYEIESQKPLGDHGNPNMTAFVQSGNGQIFVMLGNGRFYHVNDNDLSIVGELDLSDQAAVRGLSADPNGKLAAIVLRSGQLIIYDAETHRKTQISGVPSNDVLAATFNSESNLWIGDRFRSAELYDCESGKSLKSLNPSQGMMTNAFRFVIRPLNRIFPKPGEFYKVVARLSSGSKATDDPDIDLTKLTHRDNPWLPLRNGIGFTLGMLAITCLIFQRQDF